MAQENIRLGTCRISYNGKDLGLTIGGVEVEVTTNTHSTTVDQFGETIVEERITGRNITVRAPLAETTLENMVAVMPGATLVEDSTDSTVKKVEVSTGVGTSLLSNAYELVLHPIDKAPDDASEDLIVPLAATPGAMSFAYKHDEERVYNAEFKGYPDANGLLFIYGDKAASAA